MIILQALYFFLPAYAANMAPVFAAKIFGQKFSQPMDFGKRIGGKRIFGDHKTWRGLVVGTAVGLLVALIQSLVKTPLDLVDYSQGNVLLFGGLLGFGAIIGDAVKSFFKRRMNLAPGASWPGFDQLDFVVGGLLFVSFVYQPSIIVIIILLIVTPILHWLANVIGFKLKLKNEPW